MQDYIRDENHEQNKTAYRKSMEELNTYIERRKKYVIICKCEGPKRIIFKDGKKSKYWSK